MDYELGRIPSPPDTRDYSLQLLLPEEAGVIRDRMWLSKKVLNQGKTPHCVGFGWAGWGIAEPVVDAYTNSTGHTIYSKCKLLDLQPGMQNGSTVRSGARVMKAAGRILSYYFGNYKQALEFVSNHGTVVLGIDWYEGMFDPDRDFIIHLTGALKGGHCLLWIGIKGKYAVLKNSWGYLWGNKGYCLILLTDLEKLLANNGEAAAAVEAPLRAVGPSFLHQLYEAVIRLPGRLP